MYAKQKVVAPIMKMRCKCIFLIFLIVNNRGVYLFLGVLDLIERRFLRGGFHRAVFPLFSRYCIVASVYLVNS